MVVCVLMPCHAAARSKKLAKGWNVCECFKRKSRLL
jgi:hypothetical protein